MLGIVIWYKLGFRNLASVSTDDMAAAEMAVDYLFDHGHRDIALYVENQVGVLAKVSGLFSGKS